MEPSRRETRRPLSLKWRAILRKTKQKSSSLRTYTWTCFMGSVFSLQMLNLQKHGKGGRQELYKGFRCLRNRMIEPERQRKHSEKCTKKNTSPKNFATHGPAETPLKNQHKILMTGRNNSLAHCAKSCDVKNQHTSSFWNNNRTANCRSFQEAAYVHWP